MTSSVDIAQLSEWAHVAMKGTTPLERRLALSNLLSAAIKMSLALDDARAGYVKGTDSWRDAGFPESSLVPPEGT